MKLITKQAFSWAHGGIRVERYEQGQEFDTDDQDLIEVSTREGWTTAHGHPAAPPDDAYLPVPDDVTAAEPPVATEAPATEPTEEATAPARRSKK